MVQPCWSLTAADRPGLGVFTCMRALPACTKGWAAARRGSAGFCGYIAERLACHSIPFALLTRLVLRDSHGCTSCPAGADSLAHDRLGCFNMSLKGHGEAIRFMKEFGVPMLVTGGGGYTKHNVARCWTYETAILTDTVVRGGAGRETEC